MLMIVFASSQAKYFGTHFNFFLFRQKKKAAQQPPPPVGHLFKNSSRKNFSLFVFLSVCLYVCLPVCLSACLPHFFPFLFTLNIHSLFAKI
jgi:hypothetical protein